MKKILLSKKIFLGLLLLAFFAFAPMAFAGVSTGDGTWEWVHPTVQGNNVNSVSFVDSATGWVAGGGGTVMKTIDSGTSWTVQTPAAFASPAYTCHGTNIGSGCNLRGIFFINSSTGWAVGDYSSIWKTTDGGATWADQHGNITPAFTPPYDTSPPTLRSVHFFDANSGVAVGDGFTFYTSNGGTTWTKGSGNGSSSLYSVQMLSTSSAVAVGASGVIYKTTNGGATWVAKTSGTTSHLNSVNFSNATQGFAVGGDSSGRLLRTIDGGESWVFNASAIPTVLTSVTIPGGDKIVTTGYGGNIRRNTVNIWTDPIDTVATGMATVTSGTTNMLITAGLAPGSTTVYVGGAAGIILASGDSGSTWNPKSGDAALSYFKSSFIDINNGWVVGENGTVSRTTGAGASWTSDNTGIDSNADLHGVDFRSSTLGFAVGTIPGAPNTAVAYRYDSGTWTAMSISGGAEYLGSVKMSDDTHGWAVGEDGVIFGTSDGVSWSTKTVPSATYSLNSVDSTSTTNGWAVGSAPCSGGECSTGQASKGIILKFNGTNWTTLPVTVKTNVNFFTSIDMVDANNGWAVGYNSYTSGTSTLATGRIYNTTDGGSTWTEQLTPTSKLIAGVVMMNTTTGYLVADEGRIGKYNGSTWTIETSGTDVPLYSVSGAASGPNFTIYAAGGNGTILKHTETQVESPFLEKWFALGGATGNATGPAQTITGGRYQNFSNGRLILNDSTGLVYWVHGAILTKYDQNGGMTGTLGLPISDEADVTGVTGARWNDFTNGRIYWGPTVGAAAMGSEIEARYSTEGGPEYFGLPTGDEYSADILDGRAQIMQKSIFTRNGTLGVHYVRGGVMVKYQMLGGPTGYLHLVTAEEHSIPDVPGSPETVRADFQAGQVFWAMAIGSRTVNGGIYMKYLEWGGPNGALGLPITDEYAIALPGGGQRQRYQHGFITWGLWYGTWVDII